MRLQAFRVQNYKKVRDTGRVTCHDLTAFVGKNEAGKSAVFRGLSKLNPSDGEKYDPLKEFPRRRFTDEFTTQDWPVATGWFTLDDGERVNLAALCDLLRDVREVQISRHYSWELEIEYSPPVQLPDVAKTRLRSVIERAVESIRAFTGPDDRADALRNMKEAILAALGKLGRQHAADGSFKKEEIDQILNDLSARANEQWQKELMESVLQTFRTLREVTSAEENLRKAEHWLTQNMPKFVYFDRYDVINSAIHLPSFARQLAEEPGAARVRTTNCLFKHVGLDMRKLSQLAHYRLRENGQDESIRRQIDERAIRVSSASNAMTRKFADWWEQRRHEFRYQLDGDYFRVWVRDDLDPSEVELDQRSYGMQYFFSFYTVFLVETEGAHANSILLLDEPALHLHGTAQAKAVKFLEKLSADNQTMYTTHSPFMINADHLERVRAVYEAEDGTTRVSEDVWPRDKDSLFPLQAALGYQLAQSLFISKRQILVEGISDLCLLKALDEAMGVLRRPRLRPDVVLTPSAGVSKLLPLASMLIGHNIDVAALLDGDEPGRKEGKKLAGKLLAGDDRKCVFIGDFVGSGLGEIEDIFEEEYYLAAVSKAFPGFSPVLTEQERQLSGQVRKAEAACIRQGLGPFEKWVVAAVLRDAILGSPQQVPKTTLDIVERIFCKLNALFPAH
ncbi:MAG: hypothetical protein FJ291_03915 [Planctomycetes bacterium]|nr:hypothetical protein [Planctomycetota bacterium]